METDIYIYKSSDSEVWKKTNSSQFPTNIKTQKHHAYSHLRPHRILCLPLPTKNIVEKMSERIHVIFATELIWYQWHLVQLRSNPDRVVSLGPRCPSGCILVELFSTGRGWRLSDTTTEHYVYIAEACMRSVFCNPDNCTEHKSQCKHCICHDVQLWCRFGGWRCLYKMVWLYPGMHNVSSGLHGMSARHGDKVWSEYCGQKHWSHLHGRFMMLHGFNEQDSKDFNVQTFTLSTFIP